MLIKELISRVQSLYSKGVKSDDSRLTSRHIYNKLVSARNFLITQKANAKQKISEFSYQTLCLTLTEEDLNQCSDIPGRNILYTILPSSILSSRMMQLIASVSSADGNTIFSETTREGLRYNKGRKYTANNIEYFIQNDRLYLTTCQYPEQVVIRAVFEDPLEIAKESDDGCTAYDKFEFSIDSAMTELVIERAHVELVQQFSQAVEDKVNNTTDNATQGQQR